LLHRSVISIFKIRDAVARFGPRPWSDFRVVNPDAGTVVLVRPRPNHAVRVEQHVHAERIRRPPYGA